MLVTVSGYEQNPSRIVGVVAHTRFPPYVLYSKTMTKSHIYYMSYVTHVKLATSQTPICTSSSLHVEYCV